MSKTGEILLGDISGRADQFVHNWCEVSWEPFQKDSIIGTILQVYYKNRLQEITARLHPQGA